MIFLYAEAAFHSDSVDGKSGLTSAIMYVEQYAHLHERLCKPFLSLNYSEINVSLSSG